MSKRKKAKRSITVNLSSDAALPMFRVGMSIKGPPELFGLPPNPPGIPPSHPCVVTAVDYVNGIVTLDTAPTSKRK